MIPKQLQWKHIAGDKSQWIGEVKSVSYIRFVIEKTQNGKYLITPNVDGIRKLIVRELEYAKSLSQEQFNGYAMSLFDTQNIKHDCN